MNLNADLTLRIVDHARDARWLSSPNPAVHRRMLDRIGDEVARATTIVRYAAGARFDRHRHGGGEEILVLDGVFSDEQGDHPAGTYLRNPPGSAHAPFSQQGCLLFVKLWQFAADDLAAVRIDTGPASWACSHSVGGVEQLPLHAHDGVVTVLERWAPHAQITTLAPAGGAETLVLAGEFSDEGGDYATGSWLRIPAGRAQQLSVGLAGALVYRKVGHLGAALLMPPS